MTTFFFDTVTQAQALGIRPTDNLVINSNAPGLTASAADVVFLAPTPTEPARVQITLGARTVVFGADIVAVNAAGNIVFGDASKIYLGGSGNDSKDFTGLGDSPDGMFGASGADSLNGGGGGDRILGDDGNDTLLDQTGADTLSGGEGDDSLGGGEGADLLIGGAGFDTASFSGLISDFSVQTLPDGRRTVTDLRIGSPLGADTLSGIETLRFSNGDLPGGPPTVDIVATDANKSEGNSGVTFLTFTLTRTGDLSGAASVNWAVAGSGANPANTADFIFRSFQTGQASFSEGQATAQVQIYVGGDTAPEANETFTVTLTSPTGGLALGQAVATATIINDDGTPPPTTTLAIAATDASKAEGASGSTPLTFTVTRGGDTAGATSANWAVAGSGPNPANAADFIGGNLPAGQVNFAAGELSKAVTVNVAGDTSAEPSEGFTVTLSNPSAGAAIQNASAAGVISDDDTAPATTLAINAVRATNPEGNSGATPFPYLISRFGDLSGSTTATWTVTGSGANPANGADFTGGAFPTGQVSFAPGEDSKTVFVNVAGDSTVEPYEDFTVTLSNPTIGVGIVQTFANGVIADDDLTPIFTIAATDGSRLEGDAGSTALTFTVTRSGGLTGTASVDWGVFGFGSTQANAADFVGGALPSGHLDFAAGEASKQITVNVAGDTAVETLDTFKVELSNPVGAGFSGPPLVTGSIVNDDPTPALSIAATDAAKAEGAASATAFTFTVTRAGAVEPATSVNWAVTGSGANPANAADFTGAALPSGQVSFAAGETSKTVTVNVAGDAVTEPSEGFTVTLSNPTNGAVITTPSASGAINNDDFGPTVSIAATDASKAEGNAGVTFMTFTVTRTGDLSGAASVNWTAAPSGVSPANASDFIFRSFQTGQASFSEGEATTQVQIYVAGDTAAEANETFTVTLSSPTAGLALGQAVAAATIINDDGPPPAQTLIGTTGSDTLNGGPGADVITGGRGKDQLFGGGGPDQFRFAASDSGAIVGSFDLINDWESDDRIDFLGPIGLSYTEATATTYAAAEVFANVQIAAGVDVVAVQIGSDLVVFADTGGDNGTFEDAVVLVGRGVDTVSSQNFI